jgi:uncharacterized protein DUF6760
VSEVRARVCSGGKWSGGVTGYPLKALYEEVAFVAYHFHWPLDQVMALEHADRRRWVEEISAINRRLNEE